MQHHGVTISHITIFSVMHHYASMHHYITPTLVSLTILYVYEKYSNRIQYCI